MTNNQNDFGRRIQQLRLDKGITQDTFAQQVHISSCYAGKLEQGTRTPSLELCITLAEYFNVTLDYLVCGKCTAKELKEAKKLIHSAMESLQQLESLL